MASQDTVTESEPRTSSVDDWAKHYSRLSGYGVYAVTLLVGFAEGISATEGVHLLTAFAFAWMLALHFALSARAHGKVFVFAFWRYSLMFWPFAPLFHMVRTRGARGALSYALHACLLVFCLVTSSAIGSLISVSGSGSGRRGFWSDAFGASEPWQP